MSLYPPYRRALTFLLPLGEEGHRLDVNGCYDQIQSKTIQALVDNGLADYTEDNKVVISLIGRAAIMKRVVVESPLGTRPDGSRCSLEEFAMNQRYALACVRDCIKRNEAPYASHVFFPLVLNDHEPADRAVGIAAGFAWGGKAQLAAVYTDRGITDGMRKGIKRADRAGIPHELRQLGSWE